MLITEFCGILTGLVLQQYWRLSRWSVQIIVCTQRTSVFFPGTLSKFHVIVEVVTGEMDTTYMYTMTDLKSAFLFNKKYTVQIAFYLY